LVFAASVAGAAYAVDGPAGAPLADPAPAPPSAVEQAASTPGEIDVQSPDPAAAPASEDDAPASPAASPASDDDPPSSPAQAPASEAATPAVAADQPPADPIVAAIRSKLADPALRKGAASADLAALQAFYAERSGPPLWITGMGFSARAQTVIGELQSADEWGLSSEAFDLPRAGDLPATTEAQATDEIKLSLAILKYARAARGGRVTPSRISVLFDQKPDLRNPKSVMTEIAASAAPDAYLRSLHPQQEQFERLRQALVKARANSEARGRKPGADPGIQRLIVNMERWRWMPAELGSYYVWNNVPAFTTRVIKNGKTIYVEKVIVGKLKYATPIFSSPMRSIVFNPQWVVPETVKLEDLQPRLRQGTFLGEPDISILREHKLSVSYQGRPVDAEKIDWGKANILHYTFTQPPGPENVLGTLKFNFPNKHAIYMHDTVQPELFAETVRTLSHGCIRVHDPDRLAALLLAEDKGWSAQQVKTMLAKGNNSAVPLKRPVPVHLTYFTIVVDDQGKVQTFADVYGLDSKLGAALLGKAVKLQAAPTVEAAAQDPRRKESAWRSATQTGGLADSISGLFGN